MVLEKTMTHVKTYIDYQVELTGEIIYSAGPYESWEEANTHFEDIIGYEGVHDVKIRTVSVEDGQ
jgi:hypothetical protein